MLARPETLEDAARTSCRRYILIKLEKLPMKIEDAAIGSESKRSCVAFEVLNKVGHVPLSF